MTFKRAGGAQPYILRQQRFRELINTEQSLMTPFFSLSPTLTFHRAWGAKSYIWRVRKFQELINTEGSWVEPHLPSTRRWLSNELEARDLTSCKRKNVEYTYVRSGSGRHQLFSQSDFTLERARGLISYIWSEQKLKELMKTDGSWVTPAFLLVRLCLITSRTCETLRYESEKVSRPHRFGTELGVTRIPHTTLTSESAKGTRPYNFRRPKFWEFICQEGSWVTPAWL